MKENREKPQEYLERYVLADHWLSMYKTQKDAHHDMYERAKGYLNELTEVGKELVKVRITSQTLAFFLALSIIVNVVLIVFLCEHS